MAVGFVFRQAVLGLRAGNHGGRTLRVECPRRIGLVSRTLRDGNWDNSLLMRCDGRMQSARLPHAAAQRTAVICAFPARLSSRCLKIFVITRGFGVLLPQNQTSLIQRPSGSRSEKLVNPSNSCTGIAAALDGSAMRKLTAILRLPS